MAHSDLHNRSDSPSHHRQGSPPASLPEHELAGRWVAVDPRGGSGLRYLPSGGVIVDYDSELDLLCQRVAAAGRKRLSIFRYEDHREADGSHCGPRHAA
jgi:hypothetical protein